MSPFKALVMKMALVVLLSFITIALILAQTPQSFKYMAVARNLDGEIISNTNLGVQISILKDGLEGEAVYIETFSITSNDYGVLDLDIGTGNATSGSFSDIDWQYGKLFIKVAVDINGGSDFASIGGSQILSVPYSLNSNYALNAESANNVFSGDYNDLANTPDFTGWDKDTTDDFSFGFEPSLGDILYYDGTNWVAIPSGSEDQVLTVKSGKPEWITPTITTTPTDSHYIGELFGGGIVFFVYGNGQHGLIASLEDISVGAEWGDNGVDIISGNGASDHIDGSLNTSSIIDQLGVNSYAANLCNDYAKDGFNDWYLPAMWELNILYNNAYVISRILIDDSDPNTFPISLAPYWTSTEYDNNNVYYHNFTYGNQSVANKNQLYYVRAIRKF